MTRRKRWPGGKRLNEGAHGGVELRRGNDAVHEAQRQRVGGAEPFAEQKDLHCLAHAEQARQ